MGKQIWDVTVKPGSSKGFLVEQVAESSLVVYLRARAIEGKANKQLVEVLAKYFTVRKSAVTIRYGLKSRTKYVEIESE